MEVDKKKTIALVVLALFMIFFGITTYFLSKELDRTRNELTARDAQIQVFDKELGLARSSLLSLEGINDRYKSEIDQFPDKLKGIIDSYDLKLLSRDKTIVSLKNKVVGGTTIVEVITPGQEPEVISTDTVIKYQWIDDTGRFKLIDPDIFKSKNEDFSYNQYVSVTGHVLYGKDGRLQIRKVKLHEVLPDGVNPDGTPKFKDIPGGNIEIVDSSFEYADLNAKDRSIFDIIKPRLIASLDTELKIKSPHTEIRPGVGVEFLNLGRYIDHANVGINMKLTPNLDNIMGGSLLNTRIGLGVNYTFLPPILDTNFGLGFSISTPSNKLLNEWHATVDAIFYLTN
jgi:hypothetical protein